MRPWVAAVLAASVLAGCRTDPSLHSQRIGPGQYRLHVDRCHVIDSAQLHADLRGLAARTCKTEAWGLDAVHAIPSRQGTLLGECPRGGALRAEVRCAGE